MKGTIMSTDLTRRHFMASIGMLSAGSILTSPLSTVLGENKKLKVALVGTGIRGTSFWGRRLVEQYPDILEFVGLSDINPGRLEYGKKYIGVDCPIFANFEEMVKAAKPDLVIVTTMDSTHDEFIIKSLDMGINVLTEKPMTTDEKKCQAILDADRRSDKNLIVGFNYRWSPYMTKIKQLLSEGTIGDIVSVDFHWILNTYHGASYFRRWHGLRECSGTLLLHKASHHFDLLNWWIDSDPVEVFAYGDLEHYGANGPFRGKNCRLCDHKDTCEYYWDITREERLMDLYVANEQYDGYYRDNCLFRKEINIYDKMSAQIKYASNVVVNYSLTTYSPYEGWKIAFNGTRGRLEAWQDIPFMEDDNMVDQAAMHKLEMQQGGQEEGSYRPVIVHKLWGKHETVLVRSKRGGHGGGDEALQDKLFKNPNVNDPYKHTAGIRDGAMAILIGIAARKSIESQKLIKIADLTDLEPSEKRILI